MARGFYYPAKNIKLKTKADFSIDNDPLAKGVIVQINLPVIHNNENTNS